MKPIIVIRPQPGASASVANGQVAGLRMHAFPMSELRAMRWQGPDPANVDALLIGSANAIRLGGDELARYREKPVYAVGATCAGICVQAGFSVAGIGTGGLQQLLASLPREPQNLLRVAGRDHVTLDVPSRISVETRIAYERVDLPMPAQMAGMLRDAALVLLYSAGGARHFAGECERLGIDRSRVGLAALGPRIATAAGSGWQAVRATRNPTEQDLLALAADMCQ